MSDMCHAQMIGAALTHTARRRTHRCCRCGEVVALGERYERQRQIVDGEPSTVKLHEECAEARDRSYRNGFEDCWIMGDQTRGESIQETEVRWEREAAEEDDAVDAPEAP